MSDQTPPGPPPGWNPPPPPGQVPPPGYGYAPVQQEHPQGTIILVLGILGLVSCGVLGPIAWIMGNKALAEIDARPGYYSNRGNVAAGRVLGMITSILILAAVALGLIALIFAVTLGRSSSSSALGI